MIRVLPPQIANQIAAGEVVQRPASVVKELMENAVDAGASEVVLTLADSGRTLISVTDDGCGMAPEDAATAFLRHATSKISAMEDLDRLCSFGFRGEALASIAAVSYVSVRTRRPEDSVGTQLFIEGGGLMSQEEISCPPGSCFEVRNLFYNVPARRKFLKSDATEFKAILAEFQRIALCRLETAFVLVHNGKTLYNLPAVDNLVQRAVNLMGSQFQTELVPLRVETAPITIRGYVGNPSEARKTGGNQFFFVNKRFFRSGYFHKAVMNAYEHLLPEGKVPSYFIFFETDPAAIDVNIHPTKTEVKFQEEPVIFQVLQAAVRESLGRNAFGPSIDFDQDGAPEILGYRPDAPPIRPPQINYDPLFNPFHTSVGNPPFEKNAFTVEPPVTEGFYVSKDESDIFPPFSAMQKRAMSVKGQYLLSPAKSGLMLIHIPHARERIAYEELLKNPHRDVRPQALLSPFTVEVPPALAAAIDDIPASLRRLGYTTRLTESASGSVLTVEAVPENTAGVSPEQAVKEVLEALAQDPDRVADRLLSDDAARQARSHAVRWEHDNPAAAQDLIDRLFACEDPMFTPSGHPVFCILSMDDLEMLLNR